MPQLPFLTLDVFTTTRFAGNPLGLVKVPKGQDVSTEDMQTMAREFNLSETVFLHEGVTGEDGIPEWRVRIFMTTHELPFAGHPTIGTAVYAMGTLANGATKGRLNVNAGPILLDYKDGAAKASIPHNVHIHTEKPFTEVQVYELQPALRGDEKLKPVTIDVVSPVKGMSFVAVELQSLEALGVIANTGVKPQPTLDREWNIGFAGSYFYVVTKFTEGEIELRTRMMEGAFEDPATGSAACALGSLLALKHKQKKVEFVVTQAVEMGRKSDIGVTVTLKEESLDAVEKVELSGAAVKVMEGSIEY
jgi:PhzF family phenazine biosynthesis protein